MCGRLVVVVAVGIASHVTCAPGREIYGRVQNKEEMLLGERSRMPTGTLCKETLREAMGIGCHPLLAEAKFVCGGEPSECLINVLGNSRFARKLA
mmetsp:Transcript_44973/g.104050  ORF Transcript_44973/g.104050 Transcript_44973/m.104050 type:complete len:95 (-) Transcript_44973:15-299(-)|eukprot:3051764-Amphidinium_carterae.1